MCGIAGIISPNPQLLTAARLQQMTDAIAHRGPDGEAIWINKTGHTGLAHRRLSIIDLSAAAAQPMHYADRYSIVHNGEVYNYIELKEILHKKGYRFHTQSDTEVMLAAYDYWKEDCVQHFDGMFAFAIWDETEQVLFAARDRFGEKPFYFYEYAGSFLFASEMKALWAAGAPRAMDHQRLLMYLATGHTGSPVNKSDTFFKDIHSLPPAHYLQCRLVTNSGQLIYTKQTAAYWQLRKQSTIPAGNAVEQFSALFTASVQKRLRSDVKLGTSLSGGIDSSSVVAAMRQTGMTAGSSFSATFPGFERDESKMIDLVVKSAGIENYQVHPTAEELVRDMEKLFHHHEEPVSSSSIYAQYRVFALAKQHGVTVLLDGQGADEMLAGYSKYIHWYLQELVIQKQYAHAIREKKALRRNGALFAWSYKNYLAAWFPHAASRRLRQREIKKVHSLPLAADFLSQHMDTSGAYKPVVTTLNDMLHFDTCTYGLEELLRYADRNAMAHGREVRLPFLQHELVEFVFSLPATYKIHDGWTKWLLRKTMENRLPAGITWRKDKVGFETPQKRWMQHPMVQEYIQEAKRKLVNNKILDASVLYKKIQPLDVHAADNYDWRYLAVASLM